MKIGLVCPYNLFAGGGVQECVLALRDGIEKRGHDCYIITPQPKNFAGQVPSKILLVGGARPIKSFHTSAQVSASVDLDRMQEMLDYEKFDVLHFHEPWVPVLSRQILTRSNAINIATFHASLPDRMMTRTLEKVVTPYTKSILKYLDVLTAVSPTASKYVRSLTSRKLTHIANGIDLSKYSDDSSRPRNAKTIFYVGRLEKRKGVKYLLKAFALLQEVRGDYTLLIAGDGPDREKLEEYVTDNNILGVQFLGFVTEEQKLQLFKESALFCSPALYGESFGIVLLEAMASGCVTIAGNNPGYEGVLKGTGQISIVNPKDTVEFARRIDLLCSDQNLRKLWLEWADHEVKSYDYDKIIDQYVSIYEAAYAKIS